MKRAIRSAYEFEELMAILDIIEEEREKGRILNETGLDPDLFDEWEREEEEKQKAKKQQR